MLFCVNYNNAIFRSTDWRWGLWFRWRMDGWGENQQRNRYLSTESCSLLGHPRQCWWRSDHYRREMHGDSVQYLETSNASPTPAPPPVWGGKHNIGYTALQWQTVLRGNCGHLGENSDIALLPRKTAVFLFEFHGSKFNNVALPQLPADSSRIDVHRILKDKKVTCLHNTRIFE